MTVPEYIAKLLLGYKFNFADEKQLQQGIAEVFDLEAIAFEREVTIATGDTIDFLIGNIGLEVKIGFGFSSVIRQLHRYAASDRVQELILVTTKVTHVMPPDLNGKPLHTINLGYTNSL